MSDRILQTCVGDSGWLQQLVEKPDGSLVVRVLEPDGRMNEEFNVRGPGGGPLPQAPPQQPNEAQTYLSRLAREFGAPIIPSIDIEPVAQKYGATVLDNSAGVITESTPEPEPSAEIPLGSRRYV